MNFRMIGQVIKTRAIEIADGNEGIPLVFSFHGT